MNKKVRDEVTAILRDAARGGGEALEGIAAELKSQITAEQSTRRAKGLCRRVDAVLASYRPRAWRPVLDGLCVRRSTDNHGRGKGMGFDWWRDDEHDETSMQAMVDRVQAKWRAESAHRDASGAEDDEVHTQRRTGDSI